MAGMGFRVSKTRLKSADSSTAFPARSVVIAVRTRSVTSPWDSGTSRTSKSSPDPVSVTFAFVTSRSSAVKPLTTSENSSATTMGLALVCAEVVDESVAFGRVKSAT